MSGRTPLQACRLSLAWTPDARVLILDGELAALYGVAPVSVMGGQGCPWLLGTDACLRHWRTFLRHSRPVFIRQASRYSYLENRVHVKNVPSIRWLRWLGFELEPAMPYGWQREPFHKFTMRLS